MNKLKLIIEREYLAKVKNKSFIIMTFLTPIIAIAGLSLVAFLTKKSVEKVKTIAYKDASACFDEKNFKDTKILKFINLNGVGLEEAKEISTTAAYDGLLYIPDNDSINVIAEKVQFFSKESPTDFLVKDLENIIDKKLSSLKQEELEIDPAILDKAIVRSDLQLENFTGEKASKIENTIKIGIGSVVGYVLMMFIVIYGNAIMRSVIEEKTSRIIEIIVSSVKPFYLMLGKIIGTALAGISQFLVWGILIGVLFLLFGHLLPQQSLEPNAGTDKLYEIIAIVGRLPLGTIFFLALFYFLGGYLLYSAIYAAIGAAVDNETDTQQFMMPVVLMLVVGFYVGFTSVLGDPHGGIAQTFSIIPFTSPIVMMMRVPFGVPLWEIIVSMLVLVCTFIFMVWIAAKIYRVGIFMHGKKPSFKELYRWLQY